MTRAAWAVGVLLLAGPTAVAGPKVPVVIDTDVGSSVDDVFALALAVASPELELVAVTTVGGQAEDRAWLACRFLSQAGVAGVPVAFGRPSQPDGALDWQVQYRRHPAAIFSRTSKPAKETAVELMRAKLKERPGEITLVCLGPLTNVARLLKDHPEARGQIKRIVLMGGSVEVGYNGKAPPEPEWNVKLDVPAARAVFASGVPLTVVPLDATATLALPAADRDRLFAARTPLTYQVQNLYELADQDSPVLYDVPAVAAAFNPRHLTTKALRLEVDDKGMTLPSAGKPNATLVTAVRGPEFFRWVTDRVRGVGKESLPAAPGNRVRPVEPGGFPVRVHVFEDYETDIEKRWWMSGKLETKDVPPTGKRACRAVLTQDFDDKMGDTRTMYRAVVFNPVPGPPMGPNTRMRFRYKLAGTDALRVQLYSLTNGYHRSLSLAGLKQGEWAEAAVDMTLLRRPDGSGGPLAADERIDDIQFYVDPRAELLIDDVILYEAAAAGGKRPFPKRVVFTGWFDTGKRGQEWPGDFEVVAHDKPRAWKAAKSVPSPAGGTWLRVGLRGARRLDPQTELFFRYAVKGSDRAEVELAQSDGGRVVARQEVKLAAGGWSESTVRFDLPPDQAIDELRFRLPAGAELLVDDVLLYTPGDPTGK